MISNFEDRTSERGKELSPVAAVGFVVQSNSTDSQQREAFDQLRQISFQSQVMKDFYKLATLYAKSSASVLITGESGTGKELFSRFIHAQSQRAKNNFVAVNCAAIAESLVESEFFGHEKNAFTGAETKRIGHFERANEGTILLDEISEFPLRLQAKLLRVIEEKEVLAVGASRSKSVDVRIVATSNRDLQKEVSSGRFREDLYHRINVVELRIPPLRERVEDIPLLTSHFVRLFESEANCNSVRISALALKKLCSYSWPGNVRELRNVIHRCCILASEGKLDEGMLPQKMQLASCSESSKDSLEGLSLAEVEKHLILTCLKKHSGNKKFAAAELGITTRTILNKLKLYEETSKRLSSGNSYSQGRTTTKNS